MIVQPLVTGAETEKDNVLSSRKQVIVVFVATWLRDGFDASHLLLRCCRAVHLLLFPWPAGRPSRSLVYRSAPQSTVFLLLRAIIYRASASNGSVNRACPVADIIQYPHELLILYRVMLTRTDYHTAKYNFNNTPCYTRSPRIAHANDLRNIMV